METLKKYGFKGVGTHEDLIVITKDDIENFMAINPLYMYEQESKLYGRIASHILRTRMKQLMNTDNGIVAYKYSVFNGTTNGNIDDYWFEITLYMILE